MQTENQINRYILVPFHQHFGFVCLILLTVSLAGIEIDSTRVQATTVPCLDDDGSNRYMMLGGSWHQPLFGRCFQLHLMQAFLFLGSCVGYGATIAYTSMRNWRTFSFT